MGNISRFTVSGSQEEHRFKDGTVFRGTSSAWANEQNKSAYDIVIHTDTGYIYQYANNELVVVANKSPVSPIPDDTTENVTFGASVISDDANENVIIS